MVARGECIKWIVVVGELLVVMREGRQPVVRIEGVAGGGNCESGHLFVDLNHGGGRRGCGELMSWGNMRTEYVGTYSKRLVRGETIMPR